MTLFLKKSPYNINMDNLIISGGERSLCNKICHSYMGHKVSVGDGQRKWWSSKVQRQFLQKTGKQNKN